MADINSQNPNSRDFNKGVGGMSGSTPTSSLGGAFTPGAGYGDKPGFENSNLVSERSTLNGDQDKIGASGLGAGVSGVNTSENLGFGTAAEAGAASAGSMGSMGYNASSSNPRSNFGGGEFVSGASSSQDFFGTIMDGAGKIFENIGDIPARSTEVFGKIDRHARSNPWMHIGLVGAGALLLGYIVGRSTSTPASTGSITFAPRSTEEFEEAYDE